MRLNSPIYGFVGYVVCDDRNLIVEVNAEASRLLEYAPEELRGKPLASILDKPAQAFFQMQVWSTLAQQGRLEEAYVSLLTKDGSRLPVLLNAGRVAQDSVSENHLVFFPMRRRNLFERELVEAQAAAERARQAEQAALARVHGMQVKLALQERLATIGTLVAGVIHELNNPLLYLGSNLELIEEELRAPRADAASVLEMLKDAREGAAQIGKLVKSLRVYAGGNGGSVGPVELSNVVAAAVRMTTHAVKRRALTSVQIEAPAATVLGDETRLTQVLINLLLNASQAFERADPQRNSIRVRVQRDGARYAEVCVADNGPGVPPELRRRIFEPFFTTKPVGEGTGLGLAICADIVASMSGELDVESEPGEGACFRIKLPLLEKSVRSEG
ncbi:MAG TPA: ATP-binding protein [Polyangiaceae bacterium]|nr:ATP-binding protein [Polyangiaceae bacterium]